MEARSIKISINQKQFSRFYRFMAVVLIGLCLSLLAQADEWAATLTATSNNAGEAPDYKSSSLLLAVNEKLSIILY